MKKNDFIIVAVLVVLMFGWMTYYPAIEKKFFPRSEQAEPAPIEGESLPAEKVVGAVTAPPAVAEEVVEKVEQLAVPEFFQTLENEQVELRVSSHGGAVASAVLKDYPELNEEDSGPVVLDFVDAPALRYGGLPLVAGTLDEVDGGLVYTAPLGNGRQFKRTLRLAGDYLLVVQDEFVNNSDLPWTLPALRLPTGPMRNPEGTTAMRGMSTLGIDTFMPADGVTHWGKKLHKMEKQALEFTTTGALVPARQVDWIASKSKFFVQILTPEQGDSTGYDFTVQRDEPKGQATQVSAALQFGQQIVDAGDAVSRSTRLYIGPKDFDFLKTQGMEQTEVMEFKSTGFWKFMNPVMYPIKLGLLWGLTHFALFGSYGIAILILTVIIRVLFWPLTHKSTESMQRMQALQPQMQALKEKYKDNPQRMQQETMALYKENKVNPFGGCLPMLVQIPVFIALFAVLRSAIELRFSQFLWISDLSEPENLFAGMIPIVGSLNILPLLMSATMMWQQKLTTGGSTAATPEQAQQQKMMAVMMPIMMLFFFYKMPSGLVLYWTTSQLIMIGQLLLRRIKKS
jgi:YidC/Oxa1 family membrane protein insertase